MTFLERLRSHKGGLIRLKTQLFWYGGRGWDNTPGRICLLLDADAATDVVRPSPTAATTAATTAAAPPPPLRRPSAAHLLIDGQPAWIWVVEKDVELL